MRMSYEISQKAYDANNATVGALRIAYLALKRGTGSEAAIEQILAKVNCQLTGYTVLYS